MRKVSSILGFGLGLILLCLLVTSKDLKAQNQTCSFSNLNRVPVSLDRRDGNVKFNNKRSREELTQMQSGPRNASAIVTWASVGLTRTELKYQLRVQIEAFEVQPGRFCARLNSVQADLGYDGYDVLIARRYRPGTCEYRVIVEHELTHVAVFRDALNEFYPRMLRRLERTAGNQTPFIATSPNRAAKAMQARLKTAVDPLYREMNRTLDRRNARLDTRERYEQERRRCSNW